MLQGVAEGLRRCFEISGFFQSSTLQTTTGINSSKGKKARKAQDGLDQTGDTAVVAKKPSSDGSFFIEAFWQTSMPFNFRKHETFFKGQADRSNKMRTLRFHLKS